MLSFSHVIRAYVDGTLTCFCIKTTSCTAKNFISVKVICNYWKYADTFVHTYVVLLHGHFHL